VRDALRCHRPVNEGEFTRALVEEHRQRQLLRVAG
jgi:hypothetical protein